MAHRLKLPVIGDERLSDSNNSQSTISYSIDTNATLSFDVFLPGMLVTEVSGDKNTAVDGPINWAFLALGLVVVIGVTGNILVCLAICLERRLQNATNFFLLSLAVADLFVSILVMPMAILHGLFGFWPLNYSLCNVWVTSDVLCCSSSIYHMVFISIGRFIGIRNPLRARQHSLIVSRRAVIYKIALAWLLSALVSCPITILAIMNPKNIQPDPRSCFIDNQYFLIFGSLAAFFLPMVVMFNTYILTIRLLKERAKFCSDAQPLQFKFSPPLKSSRMSSAIALDETVDVNPDKDELPTETKSHMSHSRSGSISDHGVCSPFKSCPPRRRLRNRDRFRGGNRDRKGSGEWRRRVVGESRGSLRKMSSPDNLPSTSRTHNKRSASAGEDLDRITDHKECLPSSNAMQSNGQRSDEERTQVHANDQKPVTIRAHSSYQVRSEQKATHVLGLVFAAFTVCWTPFFTLNILMGIKRDLQVSETLATTFLWLGYLSSTVNPVIYTIFNRNFRIAFKNLLLCRPLSHAHPPSSTSSTRVNKTCASPRSVSNARRPLAVTRNVKPTTQTCIL